MRKKQLITVLLVIVASLLTITTARAERDANSVVERLLKSMEELGSYRADIYIEVYNEWVDFICIVGSDNRYYIDMRKIGGQEIIYDGVNIYEIDHNDKDVTIESIESKGLFTTPNDIILMLERIKDRTYIGEKVVDGESCDVVRIVLDRPGFNETMDVAVDKRRGLIRYFSMKDMEADKVVIQAKILNIKSHNSVAEFKFDRENYPDYELVDFRR